MIDSTDDAVIATTCASEITHWNHGAETIFGYNAAEILGTSVFRIIPPHAQAFEQSVLLRILNGEQIASYEAQRVHNNGHPVEITTTVSAICDPQGKIIGISRISGDITQNKRIAEAKAQAEYKFRALVEQSLTGAYILQDEGIAYANQAFADIFGYASPQDLIGKTAIDLVASEDRVTVVSNILRRMQKKGIKFKRIVTLWDAKADSKDSVNYASYAANRRAGMSSSKAAFKTWTGKRALEYGFDIVDDIDEDPDFVSISFSQSNPAPDKNASGCCGIQ